MIKIQSSFHGVQLRQIIQVIYLLDNCHIAGELKYHVKGAYSQVWLEAGFCR
jgi:hypothetical protein